MIDIKNYFKCDEMVKIKLEDLYAGNSFALEKLDYNLQAIVCTEAPITLNIIKERLRESFGVKKISQKALDIIIGRINALGFPKTDNLFDDVYWPQEGIFDVKFLRISNRQIYDIPYQEMGLLVKKLLNEGLLKEELYRKILDFYGYEVLTEKAKTYLSFVVGKYM